MSDQTLRQALEPLIAASEASGARIDFLLARFQTMLAEQTGRSTEPLAAHPVEPAPECAGRCYAMLETAGSGGSYIDPDCPKHGGTRPQPVLDREALEDVLTRHWFEYIGQEEGYDCGCNEHGTLPPMPTVTECAKHLADMVEALVRPLPTREQIATNVLDELTRIAEAGKNRELVRWLKAPSVRAAVLALFSGDRQSTSEPQGDER